MFWGRWINPALTGDDHASEACHMCYSTCAESEIIVSSSIFVVVCCCFLSLYHRYRVLSSVCYMFFESFFVACCHV
nr:MAG TPA: hypothetical protein [Caudoviricetes sp.]